MALHRKITQKGRSGKRSIRAQMLIVYALVLLVPLTILGSALLAYAQQTLHEHYLQLMETDNRRVRTLLTEITVQAHNTAEEICFDASIKQVLNRNYESSQEYVTAVNSIQHLDDMEYGNAEWEGIYIFTDNPTVRDYKQFHYADDEIRSTEWYQKALSSAGAFWTSIKWEENPSLKDNLCIVRRMALPGSEYHAVVVIRVSDAYIHSRVSYGATINTICTDDQKVVYSSAQDWYSRISPLPLDTSQDYYRYCDIAEVEGTAYFASVSTVTLSKTNSKLYVCSLDHSGFAVIENVMRTGIILLVFAIFVPGVILVFFAGYFARRVNLLREEMHKARIQDYNIISSFSGDDELTETFEDLKFMVQDIKAKDAKMYEAELNAKELRNTQQQMEYKMLAHQINPHYLYNTLETIRMKSLTGGNREVADAIKILGRTLHYVLENTGDTMTTLSKELDHVKNYLAIQRLRFGERINYSFDIDPALDVAKYTMLPLLLQPVVENAVIHGLETVRETGHIRLEAKLTGAGELRLCVSDNGGGIRKEELERIHAMLEDPDNAPSSGIALYNIHRRIQLFYGEHYGIHLESEFGAGTDVVILLPGTFPGKG